MRTFVRLTQANLRSFFRDRAGLFWTIAFPLIFIVLFGAIFSGGGTKSTVGLVDLDGTPISQALAPATSPGSTAAPSATPSAAPGAAAFGTLNDVFTVTRYATEADATAAMKDGNVQAVIVIPKGFGAARGRSARGLPHDAARRGRVRGPEQPGRVGHDHGDRRFDAGFGEPAGDRANAGARARLPGPPGDGT